MTNKEHIETIRILIGKCGTDEQVEAINAAIRALKFEASVRENLEGAMAHERFMATLVVEAKYARLMETTASLNEALTAQREAGGKVSPRLAMAHANIRAALDALEK